MQSLFWKIFLSVLLTIIFTAIVSMVIAVWFMPRPLHISHGPMGGPSRDSNGPRSPQEEWRLRLSDLLVMHAPQVKAAIAQGGLSAAQQQLEDISATWGLNTYLLDESLNRIDGKELSPAVHDLARLALEDNDVQVSGNNNLVVALGLTMPNNTHAIMIGETPEMSPPPPSFFAWMTMLRIGPVALSLGLVSFFLTRYITKIGRAHV